MPSFAALSTTTSLVVLGIVLLALRAQGRSAVIRGVLGGSVIVAFLASPALVHALTERELQLLAQHGVFKHYGVWVFFAPALAAAALLAVAFALFRSATDVSVWLWRAGFIGISLLFAGLNAANWCSPGWCTRFGFPLAYSWWSDSVVVFNGVNLTAGTNILNFFVNFAGLVGTLVLLVRAFRRRSNDFPAPPNSA